MTPHREKVMLTGRLRGMGRDVECRISAEKVSMPDTGLHEYARLMIVGEPKDLPDGLYEVSFDGRTDRVQRKLGFWIAAM